VSETAYELGMALGIATLGSIITALYRRLAMPPGTPDAVASHARESLAAAVDASARLPADNGHVLLTAAKDAFTDGLAVAAGVGSGLLLASAVAVWLLLKPRPAPNHPTVRSARSRSRIRYAGPPSGITVVMPGVPTGPG
jgi:DHA2 family multidrug resistance protein-like MFS transporter